MSLAKTPRAGEIDFCGRNAWWRFTLFTVTCLGVLALPVQAIPLSVGVYDPSNTALFEVPGSTLSLAQMKSDVLAGYPINDAAVLDGDITTFNMAFGANQSKSVAITDTTRNSSLVVTNLGSVTFATPISGTGAFGFFQGDQYSIGPVLHGVAGEHMDEFGLTILSQTVDLGTVTVTVDQSNGTTQALQRHITASNGGEDTFYGFAAPPGVAIDGFAITTSQIEQDGLFADDIGFATSALPEPTFLGLLVVGAILPLLSGRAVRRPAR
jgi:hypothetical protein